MDGKVRAAVFGAGGHTGGLVARELAQRGFDPVLGGRDEGALARTAEDLPGRAATHTVTVDDPEACAASPRAARRS